MQRPAKPARSAYRVNRGAGVRKLRNVAGL